MTGDRAQALDVVVAILAQLERLHYRNVGTLRHALRLLGWLEDGIDGAGCQRCGAEVVQSGVGRPRLCCEVCRPSRAKVDQSL